MSTERKKSLLIADDDQRLRGMLAEYLGTFGFKVEGVSDGQAVLDCLERRNMDALILDVMMPKCDGFEVCRTLRAKGNRVPILMLTARGELPDRVAGLEIGADDYLAKPFEPREVVARIQALLRRSTPGATRGPQRRVLRSGDLRVELNSQSAWLSEKPLSLTTHEFEVLRVFLDAPGKVLSRDELLDRLRGIDWDALNRSVDVAVSRLRHRLGEDTKNPRYLKTVRGSGYLWIPEVEEE